MNDLSKNNNFFFISKYTPVLTDVKKSEWKSSKNKKK